MPHRPAWVVMAIRPGKPDQPISLPVPRAVALEVIIKATAAGAPVYAIGADMLPPHPQDDIQ